MSNFFEHRLVLEIHSDLPNSPELIDVRITEEEHRDLLKRFKRRHEAQQHFRKKKVIRDLTAERLAAKAEKWVRSGEISPDEVDLMIVLGIIQDGRSQISLARDLNLTAASVARRVARLVKWDVLRRTPVVGKLRAGDNYEAYILGATS